MVLCLHNAIARHKEAGRCTLFFFPAWKPYIDHHRVLVPVVEKNLIGRRSGVVLER